MATKYTVTNQKEILSATYPKILVDTAGSEPTYTFIFSFLELDDIVMTPYKFIVEFPFNGFGSPDMPNRVLVRYGRQSHLIVTESVIRDYYIDGASFLHPGYRLIDFNADAGGFV